MAKVEEAKLSLQEGELWAWASKAFETGALGEQFTPGDAIALARSIDSETLFALSGQSGEEPGMRRGAVASVAAIALNFRQSFNQADLEWARASSEAGTACAGKPWPRMVLRRPHSLAPRDFCGTRLGG